MLHRSQNRLKNRLSTRPNAVVSTRAAFYTSMGKRARGVETGNRRSFMPPEDWHEPVGVFLCGTYKILVQDPGPGFRHVVTSPD